MITSGRKSLQVVLAVALVLLAGVSIAYATLSATLNITFGNVTQSPMTWAVGFTGSTVSGTASGTGDVGLSCGDATVTANSVSMGNIELSKPGDKCTYTLTIANTGTIDATLYSITPTGPSSTTCGTVENGTIVCGNITYILAEDSNGDEELQTGTTLAKETGTKTVYLIAKYNNDSALPTATTTQNGAKFTIVYNQK